MIQIKDMWVIIFKKRNNCYTFLFQKESRSEEKGAARQGQRGMAPLLFVWNDPLWQFLLMFQKVKSLHPHFVTWSPTYFSRTIPLIEIHVCVPWDLTVWRRTSYTMVFNTKINTMATVGCLCTYYRWVVYAPLTITKTIRVVQNLHIRSICFIIKDSCIWFKHVGLV